MKRRSPPVANHVYIHADALSERLAHHPHDALPSLDAWNEAIAADEWIEKAQAQEPGLTAKEEEILFIAVAPSDIAKEAFVDPVADARNVEWRRRDRSVQ